MTEKPNLAILLEFGFHEIKKYIHSGFADALSKEFNIIWFVLDKGSNDFDAYFRATGHPIIYFQEKDFQQKLTSVEHYNQRVRRNWMLNQQLGAFHNHSELNTKNWKTKLVGNSLLKQFFERATLKNVQKNYSNKKLIEAFEANKIDHLLTTGYASCFAKSAVVTAQEKELKVHYLVNSWKDLFIDNFIPFRNLTHIFVWSDIMKKDYLKQMPYLDSHRIVVTGNPTFDVLIGAEAIHTRAFYAKKYNLPIDAKWLLYTMMPIGIALDEIDTITYTANKLQEVFSKEELVILVRKNPTHDSSDYLNLKLPENMRIAEHYCSIDREKDMIVQSKEGELEWLDLLQHCDLNLSVPSTVTLEFMKLNKPILNIAYNSDGTIDPRARQFFEAGFYRPLFDNDHVSKIGNPEELIQYLQKHQAQIAEKGKSNSKTSSSIIIDSILA